MLKWFRNKSTFFKNIFILIRGTAFAQLITFSISPILSRLYTPEEFGIFALYVSIVSVLGVIASGRYEMAIVIAKNKAEATILFNLATRIALVFSIILFFVILIFNHYIITFFHIQYFKFWLYLIPISMLLLSVYNNFNYYLTYEKKFNPLSKSRIYQSISTAAGNLLLAFSKISGLGLIVGQLIGQSAAIIVMLKESNFEQHNKTSLKTIMKKYAHFPLKNGMSSLLNILSNQLPIMILTALFGTYVIGLYSLVMKVLNMPLTLIGKSYSQVYFKEIDDYIKTNNNKLSSFVWSNTKKLFLLALLPSLILFFWGEDLFSLIFGKAWRESGKIASVFSLFYLVRFIYFSQSTYLIAKQLLGLEFRLNLTLFLMQLTAIFSGYYFFNDYFTTFILMSIAGTVSYFLFLYFVFKTSKS